MRLSSAIFLAFAASGCSNPATAPSPNDTAARIDVPSTIRIGQTVRATSAVTFGAHREQVLTSGWRSDNPAVATVTDGGVVTGIANGHVVISVTYGGEQRQREIRVVPDFAGRWSGAFRVTKCTWSPAFLPSWCSGLENAAGPIAFVLQQQDAFVTGSFIAQDIAYPAFVVSITEDGLLEMTTRAVTAPAVLTAASWSLRMPKPGHIDGIFLWQRSGFGGQNGYGLGEGVVSADR